MNDLNSWPDVSFLMNIVPTSCIQLMWCRDIIGLESREWWNKNHMNTFPFIPWDCCQQNITRLDRSFTAMIGCGPGVLKQPAGPQVHLKRDFWIGKCLWILCNSAWIMSALLAWLSFLATFTKKGIVACSWWCLFPCSPINLLDANRLV
jgi:hypothetical protein